jgi:tRNA-dihydrouridine synthase A
MSPERAAAGRRLCVAPMMERTDRHCRYLLRLSAPHAWLYTEMISAKALLHGDRARLLEFHEREHPVGLQLGGGDPRELAEAARFGAAEGYDEINLNVGCPSERVQSACFGAALMLDAERVGECVDAMRNAVDLPVTVKTRLGVDQHDSYEFLADFVERIADAGCGTVIVHARKAWLKGLSPKQNREIPPLDYASVHRLKRDFPTLEVIINGGFDDVEVAAAQLEHVDGIMLGRAVYHDPWLLARLDARLFETSAARTPRPTRARVLEQFLAYVATELDSGTPLKAMTRHLMGLCAAQPGARGWRRSLSELAEGEAGWQALRNLVRSHCGRSNDPAHRAQPARSVSRRTSSATR